METFWKLSTQKAFLLQSSGNRKGFVYSKEQALFTDGFSEGVGVVDMQQCARDMNFSSNLGVILEMRKILYPKKIEMSKSQEANIADIASECIISSSSLLLSWLQGKATIGFLTNLPKG